MITRNEYYIEQKELSFSLATLENYLKILQSGKKEFWASEVGLKGGAIQGLHYNGLIKPTNERKEVMIPLDGEEGKIFKKVQVIKWQIIKPIGLTRKVLNNDINFLTKIVKGFANVWKLGI